MKHSDQLKQKRAAHLDALQALVDVAETRALTNEERERTKQLRGQIEAANAQIEAAEAQEAAELRTAEQQAGNSAKKEARAMIAGIREARNTGGKQRVEYRPEMMMRAAMTPASNSAGKSAYTGTDSVQLQATEDLSWLNLLTIDTVTRNGETKPYIKRANRTTPDNKAYTDSTTEQAMVVDAYTVALKNYYVRLAVHNDVLRDSADANLEQVLFGAARQDIQRQIAYHVLYGPGTNAFTGLTSTADIQTVAGGGVAISDYKLITEAFEKLMSNANVNPQSVAVLMHPKVWKQFADLEDTTGQPLMRPKELQDVPFIAYSRIPTDQGASDDETSIIVADFSQWVLNAEGYYEISTESGPNMAKDYSDMMLTFRADLKTIDPASAVVITAVQAEA